MQKMEDFEDAYKQLNKEQKEAVDTIEGPVMVVAGPGTGKTQVLALRIAYILKNTDTKADSILSLTFTNSGVKAMKRRLEKYVGNSAHEAKIATFHSFALELIEKNYELVGFQREPKLLDDSEAVFLVDEILHEYEWEHIRPRTNPTMYFGDLKYLISLLKRERMSPEKLLSSVNDEIKSLKKDPDNISSRGESKGQLKKEIEKKIESLQRTLETVEFYRIYEEKKKERGLMDYDDVLEYAVELAENYEDVRADIKEEHLYVLVDEHQDSSGVQNSFLKAVWKETEKPNIFVVGDDRQLIYGFSGASLSYFEEFSHIFGKAKLITLVENYRSTAPILALADDLLKSSITKEKLKSNIKGTNKPMLSEYAYPRDEIIGAGLYFKQKIKEGIAPEQCVLLVPKNRHVREAMNILSNMGIKVSSGKSLSLWSIREVQSLHLVLKIIANPLDSILLSQSLLDHASGIPPLLAHKFLKSTYAGKLTIEDIARHGGQASDGYDDSLFSGENPIGKWGNALKTWVDNLSHEKISMIVATVGNELLIDKVESHAELLRAVEVVRSFIHTAMLFEQKNENPHPNDRLLGRAKFADFLNYFKRLESYGSHISLDIFGSDVGVQVMTLHKSKGLEYKVVWIAHINEETLMSEKKGGFTLPDSIKELTEKRNIESVKRELYVAITRAKEFCAISYAMQNYNGAEMELAQILRELPKEHFTEKTKEETEKEILADNPKNYVMAPIVEDTDTLEEIKKFAKENYTDAKVSVTLLNNFFECPRKWYFRNFLKLPEVKGNSLALGSAVHSTIEHILKATSLPKSTEIKDMIRTELVKEGIGEGSEFKKLAKDAEEAVKNWTENYYPYLAKDYASERNLQFRDNEFPDLLMHGKIDLTERSSDGHVSVTDFKTGSVKTKSAIEKLDDSHRMSGLMRQLAMYSYLVAGSEKGKKVSTSRLLFLEAQKGDKNALYETQISTEQIDLLKKDIADYIRLIENGDWLSKECNFNSYGKNTECEYCALMKRLA